MTPCSPTAALDVGINRFAVELRFHAREEFPLLLGNTEALEGAFHVIRHFFPAERFGCVPLSR